MKLTAATVILVLGCQPVNAFTVHSKAFVSVGNSAFRMSADDENVSKLTDEEVVKVGNLVADDEWMGLSMELSELVRVAVIEDLKEKTRDFTGKDDYKVRFQFVNRSFLALCKWNEFMF